MREDIETVHRAGLALGCEGSTVAQALQFVEWGVDMVEQNELAPLVKSLPERPPVYEGVHQRRAAPPS